MSYLVKRQHFVPRTFLDKFSEQRGNEYFIEAKNTKAQSPNFNTNIKNVCVKRHLYTINFANATKDEQMLLENFYNTQFEAGYNEIYQLLIDPDVVQITQEQKEKIISTVISMYSRVAKWLNESKEQQRQILNNLLSIAKKFDYPTIELPNGEVMEIGDKSIADILDELEPGRKLNYIQTQIEQLNYLFSIRKNDNLSINVTHNHHEFLTSDVPIVLNNGEQVLIDRITNDCHIMLNISPSHCLTIMPPYDGSSLQIVRNQMPDASSFLYTAINNDHQFRNSENFVLGSKSGIKFFEDNEEIVKTREAVDTIIQMAEGELKGIVEMYDKFYYRHKTDL